MISHDEKIKVADGISRIECIHQEYQFTSRFYTSRIAKLILALNTFARPQIHVKYAICARHVLKQALRLFFTVCDHMSVIA
jgi:hypothetical protein